MACALPCCVVRVSGSDELVQDGRAAATFSTDDTDGLGQAGNRRGPGPGRTGPVVAERFDMERVADEYDALYARIRKPR